MEKEESIRFRVEGESFVDVGPSTTFESRGGGGSGGGISGAAAAAAGLVSSSSLATGGSTKDGDILNVKKESRIAPYSLTVWVLLCDFFYTKFYFSAL